MIYNNSNAGDIGYESSQNSRHLPKIFTPMEISPIPYSHQIKTKNQKSNSNSSSTYKLNLPFETNESNIHSHKIENSENLKLKENFCIIIPNRKISSPIISRNNINKDYVNTETRNKSNDKKIKKKKISHQKSLELFNEKFDSLVNAIRNNQLENNSTFYSSKKNHFLEDENNNNKLILIIPIHTEKIK